MTPLGGAPNVLYMDTATRPTIEVHPGRDCDVCNGVPQLDQLTTTVRYLCLKHINEANSAAGR